MKTEYRSDGNLDAVYSNSGKLIAAFDAQGNLLEEFDKPSTRERIKDIPRFDASKVVIISEPTSIEERLESIENRLLALEDKGKGNARNRTGNL